MEADLPVGLYGQLVPPQQEERPRHLLDVVRTVRVEDVAHLARGGAVAVGAVGVSPNCTLM